MAPSPDGPAPHRRRAHVPLQLALRARARGRVPAPDREHGHEPRGRGGGRADRGLAALARDRLGRGDDVPARPHGAAPGGGAQARRRGGRLRGRGARSGSACPTRASPAGTTRSRAGSSSRTPSSRTSSSSARTGGRPTTSPRRSRTGWTGSRTSSAATTTSRTRRSSSRCSRRSAPSRPCTRTCRASSARTAASSRSGTARSRSTSSGTRATCPRRSELPRAPRLGARRRDDDHGHGRARRALLARARRLEPATFDYAKLDWMNGVYLRDLPSDVRRAAARLPPRAGRRVAGGACARRGPLVQEKIGRLGEFTAFAGFLFHDVEPDPSSSTRASSRPPRPRSRGRSRGAAEAIEAALKRLCDALGEKPRTVYLPIRVAVTGSRVSPASTRASSSSGATSPLRGCGRRGESSREQARRPGRRRARPVLVARGHAGADRRLRRCDRRPAVDPRRPRARRAGPVRDDDRARVPHALALRADALRAAPARRAIWS